MDVDWSMRPYENGDEEAIYELECAVRGETGDKDRWLRRWNWKYRHNPAGNPIIWLAESDAKLVGQYPINCVKMKVGTNVLKGSQMVDLMTHPDYQRQGISLTLANQALNDAGNKGLDITYGFPNKAAYPGHLKLGYSDIGVISAMIKPLNLQNILIKYISNRFLLKTCVIIVNLILKALYGAGKPPEVKGLAITRVPAFDERINDLWHKVSNDYRIMVVRDKEYLNWRYVDIPGAGYAIYIAEKDGEIVGYTVLRCNKQQKLIFGRIFELVVPSGHEPIAQSLIMKAVEFFKDEKADLVLYRMIADKAVGQTVRKSGFISLPSVGNKLRFIARANTPGIPGTFLRERAHWFVQTGDSDAI